MNTGPWVLMLYFINKKGMKNWVPDYENFDTSPGVVRTFEHRDEALARAVQIRLTQDWVIDVQVIRKEDL